MTRRLLVVSPVHPADDPRIRHKLIRSLEGEWEITFATGAPGPADRSGLTWMVLPGGRVRRDMRAARLVVWRHYDVASVHDPELLPAAIVAGLLGRTVVFDVHEDVPSQLRTKAWLPRPLRTPVAWVAAKLLRLAERVIPLTLAESGYQSLFRRTHPVFPNYLVPMTVKPRPADPEIGVVYLGDITPERGIEDLVKAVAAAGIPTATLIGRCADGFRTRLETVAAAVDGFTVRLTGFLPPAEALPIAAAAELGVAPLRDLPNYRNSLPTKVLEYLALGVPVVASDLPGTRQVVGNQPGVVLAAPGDTAAWVTALRDAHNNPTLRMLASREADGVRQRFTWPADSVRSFYAGLLEGS